MKRWDQKKKHIEKKSRVRISGKGNQDHWFIISIPQRIEFKKTYSESRWFIIFSIKSYESWGEVVHIDFFFHHKWQIIKYNFLNNFSTLFLWLFEINLNFMSFCFLTEEKMKIYVCIYRKIHPSSEDVCRSLVKSLRYIANKICIFCSHIPGLYICHYLSVRLSVSSEMCQMVCIRCLINMLFATNWLSVSVYKKISSPFTRSCISLQVPFVLEEYQRLLPHNLSVSCSETRKS